jgi:hypothetical protein
MISSIIGTMCIVPKFALFDQLLNGIPKLNTFVRSMPLFSVIMAIPVLVPPGSSKGWWSVPQL